MLVSQSQSTNVWNLSVLQAVCEDNKGYMKWSRIYIWLAIFFILLLCLGKTACQKFLYILRSIFVSQHATVLKYLELLVWGRKRNHSSFSSSLKEDMKKSNCAAAYFRYPALAGLLDYMVQRSFPSPMILWLTLRMRSQNSSVNKH